MCFVPIVIEPLGLAAIIMSKKHEPGNGLSIRIHGLSSDFAGRADFGRHWLTTFRRFDSTYPFRRFPADALA
jgi:hypothetical protein